MRTQRFYGSTYDRQRQHTETLLMYVTRYKRNSRATKAFILRSATEAKNQNNTMSSAALDGQNVLVMTIDFDFVKLKEAVGGRQDGENGSPLKWRRVRPYAKYLSIPIALPPNFSKSVIVFYILFSYIFNCYT